MDEKFVKQSQIIVFFVIRCGYLIDLNTTMTIVVMHRFNASVKAVGEYNKPINEHY